MSRQETLHCQHCGRSDFKSQRGLHQHLTTSEQCKVKHLEQLSRVSAPKQQEEDTRVREILANAGERLTRSRVVAQLAEESDLGRHHDVDANAPAIAVDTVGNDYLVDGADLGALPDQEVNPSGDEANDFGVYEADDSTQEGEDNMSEAEEIDDSQDPQPSTAGLDDFNSFCRANTFFSPFTRAEESGINLMDVLRKKKAPMNAYASVMEWHLREKGRLTDRQMLVDAGRDYIGRHALLNRLAERYNMNNKKPQEKIVRLPSSKEVVRIPLFDAQQCIVQLLTNPLLEDEDFDFFNDDPLAPPPNDLDYIGNNNTGLAHRQTYEQMIKLPNQQLIGVIFYIDGATTGHFADLPVTAVKLSLNIFTREARLKEHMWAILGYLPQIKVADSRGKKLFQESQHLEAEDLEFLDGEGEQIDVDGDLSDGTDDGLTDIKAQDFHFMLSVILSSYVELEATGMMWHQRFKNRLFPGIHYQFFTAMIRSDTEEADSLCAKYKPRTRNIKHICRQCHVPTMQAANHRAAYAPKTQQQIEKLIRQGKLDRLKQISQHYLKNAWYVCRFNPMNGRGIHGACPSEMLHQLQLGIFKYCRDIFFTMIGKSAKVAHEINGLAKIYGKLLSHQSDRSLPATNFSKGIKDGKLMAKDYRGVLLIMVAVLRSTVGRKMLSKKRKFKEAHKKDDWILLVELLLEWEAYLCLPTLKKKHVARLDKKHRYIMCVMRKVARRSEGMGLNIIKFHAITHLMEDIQTNGVPLEFDTAANESHHKPTKYAAQLTQRNEATFMHQVAVRLWEFMTLDLALDEIRTGRRVTDYFVVDSDESVSEMSTSGSDSQHSTTSTEQEPKISTDDAQLHVYFDEEDQSNSFELISRGRFAGKTTLNIELLAFLIGLQDTTLEHLPQDRLPIFTRHQRDGQIFHAHPNYRGQGAWKDWAVFDWGVGYGHLPCHIQCFVELTGMPTGTNRLEYGGIGLKDGVYAVVEEAQLEDAGDELQKSDLLVPFLKTVGGINNDTVTDRVFYLADTEAIVRPCAMIPDIGGPTNRYFMVKGRADWAKEFVSWVERPHHEDEMSDEEDE